MTTPSTLTTYDSWIGRNAYDINGDKIGTIDNIYYDDVTGQPEWVAITTGWFGTNTTFAPIAGTTIYQDGLQLRFDKDTVKGAPNVDPANGHLTAAEEQQMFQYYGMTYAGTDRSAIYGTQQRADTGYAAEKYTERYPTGMDADVQKSSVSQREQVGETRLRKYRVVETQQVEVPIVHEEVEVETDR